MKLSHAIGSSCVLALICGGTVSAQQIRPVSTPKPSAAPSASSPLIDSARPIMQAEEVVLKGVTPVFGDPSKIGPYIIRTRLAANQVARPHYEDQDRFITVLEGTLWIGKGDVFSPDKLLPIREGGVAYLPANTHYFQVAGENEVVLQITGNGPVKSVHTELDAKGQPVAEGGPYPRLTPPPRRRGNIDPDLLTPEQLEQLEREAAAAKAAATKKPATEKPATEKPAAK
jgi:quercetin dioxygenase-like cupin family protein